MKIREALVSTIAGMAALLGWAGGLFFVQFEWSGVAIFAAVLALFAGTTAVLALRGSEAK